MKISIKLLTFLITTFSFLTGCGGGEQEISGKVHSLNYVGFTCWYIVDDSTGYFYELVTGDEFLLQEGRKVRMKIKDSNANTVCKVGDKVEVLSYRLLSDRKQNANGTIEELAKEH